MKNIIKFLLIALLFVSCGTSKNVAPLSDDELKVIYDETDSVISELTEQQLSSESYVFIRLYEITYKDKISGANVLKKLIKTLGPAANGKYYTHSAVNYSLKDEFVGLTLGGKNAAKQESVLYPERCDFIPTNDQYRSRCTVLAVPCTELDRIRCQKLIDYSVADGTKFRYGTVKNLSMPGKHERTKIKMFIKSKRKSIEYPFDLIDVELYPEEVFKFKKHKFVCSTYAAFVLSNSIESVKKDFKNGFISPFEFTPSDLFYIKDSFVLFDCRYVNYGKTVGRLVEKYPVFVDYL